MWNLKSKINEQTKQKQTHIWREHFDGCQIGEGLGGWVKKVKKYKLVVTEQSWGCKVQHREYSITL